MGKEKKLEIAIAIRAESEQSARDALKRYVLNQTKKPRQTEHDGVPYEDRGVKILESYSVDEDGDLVPELNVPPEAVPESDEIN